MSVEPMGPVGLTVSAPEPRREAESVPLPEELPPEAAPLPSHEGQVVDESV
ncbi:hypothetical protein MASR2M78_07750 [Treponema sp.]